MNLPQLAVLNHLLKQHPTVRSQLTAHAGRRVKLVLSPASVLAVVLEDGYLGETGGEPEAVVAIGLGSAAMAVAGKAVAPSSLTLTGDGELGLAMARILGGLKWDAGEDLSRLVGDAAAWRVETTLRRLFGIKGEIAWRLAQSYAEHLREETPLLARRESVDSFNTSVDTVRDAVERAEKRLARIEAACRLGWRIVRQVLRATPCGLFR